MYLKTLTLRGFKSFASATTLSFEPGVTCIVGPNGSGKSNVVDALAWVMGEQGAKTLRGGKMDDVIFAGTPAKPPLGRAEVSLTIDNADGALPIDYSEVTITRTLFRSGGSEYAINGSACRLLDIQELLSDSGLGREMHVIVGQGRLDAVLQATPEERRGFIEEAAGVLKHRKRRERAMRKLEAMQGNLQRLQDLTAEVRRQLGPLGRQAQVARRAATIQADVRDAKARLLADDLAQLTAAVEQDRVGEEQLARRTADAQRAQAKSREALAGAETAEAAARERVAAATDTWYRLSAVGERIASLGSLAAERSRLLSAPVALPRGQDPADLEAQSERIRQTERELTAEAELARDALERAVVDRGEAEAAAAAAERQLAGLLRAAADRREGMARLTEQAAAARGRAETAEADLARLRQLLDEATERERAARDKAGELESEVAGVEGNESSLDAEHEAATAALEAAAALVAELTERERAAETDRTAWAARVEALQLGLDRKDGAGQLLAAGPEGVLGSLAATLAIEPGFEDAVAAALGPLADAVAVEDAEAAAEALRYLRVEDAGRATLMIAGSDEAEATPAEPPAGRWVADVVTPSARTAAAVRALLGGIVVVEDLAVARRIVALRTDLVAVTRAGDLFSAHRAAGGSSSAPGVLHLQSALDEAQIRLDEAAAARDVARAALAEAVEEQAAAQSRHDETLDRLHESDAALTAVSEQLAQLGAAGRAASGDAARLRAEIERAEQTLAAAKASLEQVDARHRAAEQTPEQSEEAVEAAGEERNRCAALASAARAAETEARLALRTAEERARAIAGRAASLARTAAQERANRQAQAAEQARRAAQLERAREVARGAQVAAEAVTRSLARAEADKAAAQRARAESQAAAGRARTDLDAATTALRELTDTAHRDEVARAQQQLRVEQLQERSREELSIEPDVLVEEFGPHRGVPVRVETDDGEEIVEEPYDRDRQARRLRAAERDLGRLGKVNPLALEEFAALEERHTFLADQLADLTKTRADLLTLVREIDERVEQVFTEAYEDTAREFVRVFDRMFPGGDGQLVLTDPENMLTSGIEVEARPAGKKVKRLSLLSGGERSLTAIAFLVAIFRARPSPFYVMDEVEAALDDVNLGRLLEIFRELQLDSQLIVVTHQKRTMEVADALYGVTMQNDGVTTVISQRLRERRDAVTA